MSETSKGPRCTTCAFCYIEDYGYSNYTTEGSNIHCLLTLNPRLPVEDSGWAWDSASQNHPINRFAEQCPRYRYSEAPLHMDVDHENEPSVLETVESDPELAAAWAEWQG
jgi:hypothetical protein